MNLFKDFHQRIVAALGTLDGWDAVAGGLRLDRITAEPPRDASHGDVATNAAMVLAKPLGTNPRLLAEQIADRLKADRDIAELSVAGPGFINIRVSAAYWRRLLTAIIDAGADFGRGAGGDGRKVNVEYVSANPTGPMHVGHCRGAVVGDALANLLSFAGYMVDRKSVV